MKPLIQQREGILINIDQMDGAINERCIDYINASELIEQKAALQEFVDAVIQIVEIAGADPVHRIDVVKQAKYVIGFHMRRLKSEYGKQLLEETIVRLTDEFDTALIEALLDQRYQNSLRPTEHQSEEITAARELLRSRAKSVITVVDPRKPLDTIE